MKFRGHHRRLSPRLRFALLWPILAAAVVATPPLWFLFVGSRRWLAAVLILTAVNAVAVLAVSWWLNRELWRPLEQVIAGAGRLAEGDFAARVAVPQAAELQTLAEGLNRLAGEVEAQSALLAAERSDPEALRQVQIRRDLVANVSHELKTPLTAIRGYAETLEDGALDNPEVAFGFVRSILEQCARLETLLGDLLNLSRLESWEHQGRETVNLSELARQAVEILEPQALAREVEISLQNPEDLPAVAGDREELERALLNLVENAVKYNRPGGEVAIGLRADDSEVVVEIRDTGIGIPDDALERIFERFYRVDKGRSRDQGGTGLGLSIVKHAARAHGGRVEVESRLGQGSTFRVRLPLAALNTPKG